MPRFVTHRFHPSHGPSSRSVSSWTFVWLGRVEVGSSGSPFTSCWTICVAVDPSGSLFCRLFIAGSRPLVLDLGVVGFLPSSLGSCLLLRDLALVVVNPSHCAAPVGFLGMSIHWCMPAENRNVGQVGTVGRGGQWLRKERKRTTTFVVVHIRDAPFGPPTSWVPPRVLLSHPSVEIQHTSPHPSGKGRGAGDLVSVFWVNWRERGWVERRNDLNRNAVDVGSNSAPTPGFNFRDHDSCILN
jgi:hypothetical protein